MVTSNFVLGGRALFTVSNANSTHYTFKVERKDPKPGSRFTTPSFFLYVKAGTVDKKKTYMGVVTPQLQLRLTRGSKFAADSTTVKVATFALSVITGARALPEGYSIEHAGKCGRCGKKLTHPESKRIGFGPDCIDHVIDYSASSHASVAAQIVETPAPVETPASTERPARRCDRCNGTGIYQWGASVNGVMQFSGACFRCRGTGTQTDADQRRNYGYDNYAFARAV